MRVYNGILAVRRAQVRFESPFSVAVSVVFSVVFRRFFGRLSAVVSTLFFLGMF